MHMKFFFFFLKTEYKNVVKAIKGLCRYHKTAVKRAFYLVDMGSYSLQGAKKYKESEFWSIFSF